MHYNTLLCVMMIDVPTVAGVKHRAIISKIAPLVESSFDLLRGYIRDEAASLTEAALDEVCVCLD